MTFLNPFILLGLAAAIIPLIIHLFHFRKPRKIDFSSLVFLRELQQRTMRRMRIRQWLVLLLRTLAIASLVLAFARPTLRSSWIPAWGPAEHASIAIVLDNSLSMELRDADGAYLEQARQIAQTLIREAQIGDELFIEYTASGGKETQHYEHPSLALENIQQVSLLPGASTLSDALNRAVQALEHAKHPNRLVYLISDLQASTFTDSSQLTQESLPTLTLLPVGKEDHPNVAITDVKILSRIIEQGQPVRIQATLANFSNHPKHQYVASLYLEGERVALATVSLPAEGFKEVVFTATPRKRGWIKGYVQIEDDDFLPDNRRYFSLLVPTTRRVLLVENPENPATYLKLALSPSLTRKANVEVTTIPEHQLATQDLDTYDVIILAGPHQLSSGAQARLTHYLKQGGGLIFFPSEQMDAFTYRALLRTWNAGRFGGFSGTSGTEIIAQLEHITYEHPLFEGVFQELNQLKTASKLERPEVYRVMNYHPSAQGEQPIMKLSNDIPLLEEIPVGKGTVFLYTVFPDLLWTDLPVRGLFIPLLFRSIFYLSAPQTSREYEALAGEPLAFSIPTSANPSQLTIQTPSGEEWTPEIRTLPGNIQIRLPALYEVGIYRIREGTADLLLFAVNHRPEESDVRLLSVDEAQQRLETYAGAPVHVINTRALDAHLQLPQVLKEIKSGIELWNVFIGLALLFLIAEMIVARRQSEPVMA